MVHWRVISCLSLICLTLAGGAAWLLHQQRQLAAERRFDPEIQAAASRHGIDPALVKAVIRQESRFNPNAVGNAGEIGLMQLMPGAARDWETNHHRPLTDDTALFDPSLNIEIGTWYLARGLRQWSGHQDREVLALVQYNAGRRHALKVAKEYPKNVLEHVPIASTRLYISNVLQYRSQYLNERVAAAGHGATQEAHN